MIIDIHLPPSDPTLNIQAFSTIFNTMTNSYKVYWMGGILEEVKRGQDFIPFKHIVIRMVARAWYSVLQYRLSLGKQDMLDQLIRFIHDHTDLDPRDQPEKIVDTLKSLEDPELEKRYHAFYRFVPTRIVVPFFQEQLKKTSTDHDKTLLLNDLTSKPNASFSIMDQKGCTLKIPDNWMRYLFYHQAILSGWIENHQVRYLQRCNPSTPAIIDKIHPNMHRSLTSQRKLWSTYLESATYRDIFTGSVVTTTDLSLDHFIPASFVMHNQLWNLHPVSKSLNSSKSDGLPDLNKYLNLFCDRQWELVRWVMESYAEDQARKKLEDYLDLGGLDLDGGLREGVFKGALRDLVIPLYGLAKNQGFPGWEVS